MSFLSSYRTAGFCLAALALPALAAPALADPPQSLRKPTQYVLISFDGAHEIAQWKRSRALARETGAKFTYFLSCAFLLSPQTRGQYQPSGLSAGRSNVGFAQSRDEVEQRLYQIRLANQEDAEIASHGCGHFDGGKWTAAQWRAEFAQFSNIFANAYEINGIAPKPADWPGIARSIKGFRAPYLSTNSALYAALEDSGFGYDASGISRGPDAPDLSRKVARFSLPQIPEGPSERRVIAMDYNLFARHTSAREQPDTDGIFEQRTYQAFRAAFDGEFNGARRPFELGFHFSLMNGAAYWRALERFAGEVCTKPGVACVTYGQYLARVGGD